MSSRRENESIIHYFARICWRILKKFRCYASYIRFYVRKPSLHPDKRSNNPRITISFTTYPAREKWLPVVVGSLMRQTLQPDQIVLYLSKEQFECEDRPILNSIKQQGVEIKLVDGDMRSHKKYLYALQEYPDDIIITVDDDIVYDSNLVLDLYQSYLEHPHAVSAKRVHKIQFNEDKKIKKYLEWDIGTKELIDQESWELMATGCGGVLYPPHCLHERFSDIDTILSTCMLADDLWLKIMELMGGTPVVLAKSRSYKLVHVWDTECNGLALDNVGVAGNDEQLAAICDFLNIDLYEMTINNTRGEADE